MFLICSKRPARVNRGCSVRTRENCDFPGDLVAIQREVAEI
jgi:hypothetical protein